MIDKKILRKKAFVDGNYCVACGACNKICPLGAITIEKGIVAKIDLDKCVGCSKCVNACPASVINLD
ncbi:MAG: 4Fe-4S binding protein [Clostridium sp.]|uniref:4Fe-4S binding protein n=1 Tax=Clostridium sp. TaxID=1506 RepID=UPI003061BB37